MKKVSSSSGGGRRSSAIELTSHLTLSESSSSLTVGDCSGGSTSCVTSPVSSGVGAGGDVASGSTISNRSTSSSASKTSNDSWVCPNDRQLALRAKLKSGWSIKTANLNQWKQPNPMSTNEHELILQVIEKAEAMERAEQQRVGRLVDRLEGMKRCCLGNGETDCILCGEIFRFYHRSQKRCTRCKKMTCGKCGVESSLSSTNNQTQTSSSLTSSGNSNTTIWLCKICNEGKEMWKKSGAWFYKGMPKYVLPADGKGYQHDRRHSHYAPLSVSHNNNNNGKPLGFVSAFGFANGPPTSTSLGGSPVGLHDDIGFRSGSFPGVSGKGMMVQNSDDEDDDSDEVADGMLARRRILNNHRLSKEMDSDDSGPINKLRSSSLASEDSSRSLPITIPLARSGASTPGHSTPPHNLPSSAARPLTPTGSRLYGPPPPHVATPNRLHRPPPSSRGSSPYRGPRPPPHFRPPPSGGSPPPPFASRGPPSMVVFRRGGAGPSPRLRYPRSFRGGRPPPRCPPQIVSQSAPHSPLSPQRIFPGISGGGSPVPPPGSLHSPHPQRLSPLKTDVSMNEFLAGSSVAVSANLQAKLAAEKLLQEMNRSDDLLGRSVARGCSIKEASSGVKNSGGELPYNNNNEEESSSRRGVGGELADEEAPQRKDSEYDYDEEEEVPDPAQPITPTEDDAPIKYNKAKPLNEKENKFTSTLRRLSTVRRRSKTKRKIYLDRDENNENGDKKDNNGIGEDGSRHDSQDSNRLQDHGMIEFNLIFDSGNECLTVNVVKAKRIKGMDINGLSDSYCKVILSHPGGRVFSPQCTKTVAKSINPHYNAMIQFKGVNQSVIQSGYLAMIILDEDLPGDHLLGETNFPIQRILPQMHKKFQIPLEKPNLQNTLDGLILTSNVGRVEISLAFYSKAGTLRVGILRCFDLPVLEENEFTHPYVQTQLFPGSKHSRYKTTIKWRTSNPEYHEQFVYLTSITELPKHSLHITVWDKEKSKPEEYIGGIILGLNAKGDRLHHWADMVKNPNQIHVKTHFLSANFLD